MRQKVILCALFLLALEGAYAQKIISGKVFSENSQTIVENASVVIKNGNQILGYSYTNEQGLYQMNFNNGNLSEITIEAGSLGFAIINFTLEIKENISTYTQDFYLPEKSETLSEVVLKADEKIKINHDTISFRISSFKDNSERTVEDMLKKLPGIEVADDGTIRALGKPIQKILIEGDDLASSNYKVISKNLDVDVLETIEIISNYDENPVLRQFLTSESIVLNLKLKKDKKSVLFGKIEAGGGVENRFLGDVNLGVITPGIKFLDLANANNIGNPAENQFGSYTDASISFNDFNKDFDIKQAPIVDLSGSTIELEEKNYVDNTSFLNNLLVNKRFSENLKIRNSLYFYSDSFKNKYRSEYQYFIKPQDIFFSEQNFFDQNNLNLSNDLKITYTPSKNTNITFANTFTSFNEKHKNLLLFDEKLIKQNLHNKKREQETHFQVTQKIKFGAAVIDLFAGSKTLDQNFHIAPNSFLADSINRGTNIFSKYDTTLDYQGLDGSFVFKKERTAYSFTGGFKHIGETINTNSFSELLHQYTRIDSLSGWNVSKSYQSHLQLKVEQEIFEDGVFYTDFDVIWNSYKKNNFSKNFILPNISAGFRINKTRTGSYRFNYSYITEIPRLVNFTDSFLIKSYRGLSLGVIEPEAVKSHNYSFNYTFARVEKRVLVNISASHKRFLNQLSFRGFLNQNTDITETVFTPGQKLWLFQIGLTSYVDPINTSVKLGYQKQFSEELVTINNKSTTLKNSTSQYYLMGTTYFKGFLNFKFLANYTLNIGENNWSRVYNERYKFQVKTIFNINKMLVASIESKGYIISSQFYETNSAEIEFYPKGKDWSLGINILNIFNDKEYIFDNLSEYIQTSTVFEALPRYVILFGRLRF